MRRLRFHFVCLCVASLLLLICSPSSYASPERKKSKNKKSSQSAAMPVDQHTGVFVGNMIAVDITQSSIFVKPVDREGPKRRFYFDSQTIFDSNKKKLPREEIEPGSLVAVKYFATGRTFVADIVNVLPDDVEITDEKVKRWMRGEKGTFEVLAGQETSAAGGEKKE